MSPTPWGGNITQETKKSGTRQTLFHSTVHYLNKEHKVQHFWQQVKFNMLFSRSYYNISRKIPESKFGNRY